MFFTFLFFLKEKERRRKLPGNEFEIWYIHARNIPFFPEINTFETRSLFDKILSRIFDIKKKKGQIREIRRIRSNLNGSYITKNTESHV